MAQTKDLSDPLATIESCGLCLKQACINAQSLHAYTQKLIKYQNMKMEIKKGSLRFDTCLNSEAKLDSELQELEQETLNTRQTIQGLETRVIDSLSRSFDLASSICRDLHVPDSADLIAKFDLESYEQRIENQKELIELLSKNKLDLGESKIIDDLLSDVSRSIRDFMLEATSNLEDEMNKQLVKVEKFAREQESISSQSHMERLAENITREMMGLPSIGQGKSLNSLDIPRLTQHAFHDYLGKLFLKQINGKVLYSNKTNPLLITDNPAKVRKHNRQRNKINASLKKIAQMDKESKEILDLFNKNLGSHSVQHLIENLDRIDQVTKNHQEILEFMNAPMGTSSTKGQGISNRVKNNIPSYLNVYTRNDNLSGALATCLTQHTERYYFSDLLDRMDALEKKMDEL